MTLTGNEKPQKRSPGKPEVMSLQYTCDDCGFVGWSSHWELERKKRVAEVLG